MRKISEYRNNAEECRRMVAKVDPEHRQALLTMAQTWDMLADERERALAQKERVEALGD